MPTVSIIVPVYKAEEGLPRCVASLLRQTFPDFEVLLVDDGSPDGSPGICDALAASDPRVRAIHKDNGGPGSARNRGLEEAVGRWIAFVDADDWVADDCVETLLAGVERHGADAAFCNHEDVFGDLRSRRTFFAEERAVPAAEVLGGLLRRFDVPCAMWGKLFRAEAIRALRVDETLRIGEDLLFLMDALHRGSLRTIVVLPQHAYYYDQTGASLMRSGPSKTEGDKKMLEAYLGFHSDHPELAAEHLVDHAIFLLRTLWSLAREEGRLSSDHTRLLRRHFLRGGPHLFGHESRPILLYLLHPRLGFGWYRAESAFRRWLHRRKSARASG